MRKFFSYVRIVFIVVPIIIHYGIKHRHYLRHPEKYSYEKKYQSARKEIMMVLKHFHIDLHTENVEILTKSKEPQLVVTNHMSLLDPLMYIVASEQPITFMSKKENLKLPFVGQIMRMLGSYTIDRKDLMSQVRILNKISEDLKDKTKPSCVIFIEGTRNRHPEREPLPFHPGTLKIAYKANVPIVLNSTYGTFRPFNKHSYLKRYPVLWKVHDPIVPEEYSKKNTNELAEELRNQLIADLVDLRKKDLDLVLSQKVSKKRKQLETRVDLAE